MLKRSLIFACLLLLCPSIFSADDSVSALKVSRAREKIPARILRRIHLPRWYHEGLFCDGSSIWVANGKGGKVWVVDMASGKILSDIKPIARFTEGIAGMGKGLYAVTEWDERKVYIAGLKDGRLISRREISVAPAHPAGVVWTGEMLFALAWTRGMGTKFDLLEMDSGLKIMRRTRIKKIQEPAHMAWDGKNLWVTSWYSRRIYRVDTEGMRITGFFVSPVSLTTGIAWDGRTMWVTGTYADLYQLKIGEEGLGHET